MIVRLIKCGGFYTSDNFIYSLNVDLIYVTCFYVEVG